MTKTNNWEVSLLEFEEGDVRKYKVTRRMPFYFVAETKVFNSKEKAREQFEEWLK